MVDEQADRLQLRLLPDARFERVDVELGPEPVDAFAHAGVVELDPLLHRPLRLSPGSAVEPLLRLGARGAEEAVVPVEALDQDRGDLARGGRWRGRLATGRKRRLDGRRIRASDSLQVPLRRPTLSTHPRHGRRMTPTTQIQVPADGAKIVPGEPTPDNPIIPFIEGDGIGVDITPVMKAVVDAAVAKAYGNARRIHWMEIYAGEKATRLYGSDVWLPEETLEAARAYSVSIKGPMTTPVGGGIRSLNVALRQELDLFVCLRPVRHFAGVPSPLRDPVEDEHGDLP